MSAVVVVAAVLVEAVVVAVVVKVAVVVAVEHVAARAHLVGDNLQRLVHCRLRRILQSLHQLLERLDVLRDGLALLPKGLLGLLHALPHAAQPRRLHLHVDVDTVDRLSLIHI